MMKTFALFLLLIVVAEARWGRPWWFGDDESESESETEMKPQKVYTLAVGLDYPPYDYIGGPDPTAANPALPIKGFSNEVSMLVCKAAGVKCEWVFDDYDYCWGRHVSKSTGVTLEGVNENQWNVFGLQPGQFGGEGIMSGWYDACIGWTHTFLRQNTVRFGHAMTVVKAAGFLVLQSRLNELGGEDALTLTGLTGLTVGYIENWATNPGSIFYITNPACTGGNPDCTNGIAFDAASMTLVGYDNPDALGQGLLDGEVDVAYMYDSMVEDRSGPGAPNPGVWRNNDMTWLLTGITNYAANGTAMFVRKDNGFADLWDAAMPKVLASDEYRQKCVEYGLESECHGNFRP